jgi:cytochrome P450 family 110
MRFRQSLAWARRPLELLDDCVREFGTPFTFRFVGKRNFVVFSDPESVQAIFKGSPDVFCAGKAQELLKNIFGEHSLLTLDGDVHKRHRRILSRPFRGERMRVYGEMTRDLTLRDLDRWPVGKPFSMHEAMRRIALELIIAAVFGHQEPERAAELLTAFTELASGRSSVVGYIPALQIDLGPWSPYGSFLRLCKRFDDLVYEEIAKAKASVKAGEGREDVLAKLVEGSEALGESLSDAELRDELLTLLAAGHETTAASLAWNFEFILGTPAVRDRVLKELDEVIGEDKVEAEHLKRLTYLDNVINEVFRLRSPTIVAARQLAQDVHLGGHDLPKGTCVYACGYLAHRRPDVYPDPNAFKPERFEGFRPGPFKLFPFGGGPRLCIGMPLAIFQIKVVLAAVLGRVRIRLAGEMNLSTRRDGLVVVPTAGTQVVLDGKR